MLYPDMLRHSTFPNHEVCSSTERWLGARVRYVNLVGTIILIMWSGTAAATSSISRHNDPTAHHPSRPLLVRVRAHNKVSCLRGQIYDDTQGGCSLAAVQAQEEARVIEARLAVDGPLSL